MVTPKKFVLLVQGEGRGHMTQAISMADILRSKGHEVCAAIIGCSERREIPKFIFDKLDTEVIRVESPNFITDSKNKGIKIGPSIFHNLARLGVYRKSLNEIKKVLDKYRPDAIINFFEPLGGLYYSFMKTEIPMICIAHQYIYLHPRFNFPRGHFADRMAIKWFTRLTSKRAARCFAISFYNLEREDNNVVVVPPLLRKEVFELPVKKKEYFLVYLVNNGYLEEIHKWHKRNPGIELHCFTDTRGLPEIKDPGSKFFVHALDDRKFLEMMAGAKGLVSTAGFESVCEAMYLGKPVLMVPVKGHFEQFCNSRDAFSVGAGLYDDKFNISKLVRYASFPLLPDLSFQRWVNQSQEKIYNELISVLN